MSALTFVDRDIPMEVCTVAPERPVTGIVLHHTATEALPFPQRAGSWHWCIDRDGTIYRDVSEEHAAHHVRDADRWIPAWLVKAPPHLSISSVNYCTIGIELVYNPVPPPGGPGQVPNDAQYAALSLLFLDLYGRYGRLPIVGHGVLQRDRWPSEPHGLDWRRAGCRPPNGDGSAWFESLPSAPPTPTPAPTPGDEPMPTVEELQGIIAEYERQVAALREELAAKDSHIGALEHDVVGPLTAERDALRDKLAVCQQQVQAATSLPVSGATVLVQVDMADGRKIDIPLGGATLEPARS